MEGEKPNLHRIMIFLVLKKIAESNPIRFSLTMHRLHMIKCTTVWPELRSMEISTQQTLLLQLGTVRRNPAKGPNKSMTPICRIENQRKGIARRLPLVLLLSHCIDLRVLSRLQHCRGVIRQRLPFALWRRGFRFHNIDSRDVVDARSPLVLAACKLPDEVLLSMTRHLSWRPRRHKVPGYAPPITFPILLKPQKKLPVFQTPPH